jgi:hypothetical protein
VVAWNLEQKRLSTASVNASQAMSSSMVPALATPISSCLIRVALLDAETAQLSAGERLITPPPRAATASTDPHGAQLLKSANAIALELS